MKTVPGARIGICWGGVKLSGVNNTESSYERYLSRIAVSLGDKPIMSNAVDQAALRGLTGLAAVVTALNMCGAANWRLFFSLHPLETYALLRAATMVVKIGPYARFWRASLDTMGVRNYQNLARMAAAVTALKADKYKGTWLEVALTPVQAAWVAEAKAAATTDELILLPTQTTYDITPSPSPVKTRAQTRAEHLVQKMEDFLS